MVLASTNCSIILCNSIGSQKFSLLIGPLPLWNLDDSFNCCFASLVALTTIPPFILFCYSMSSHNLNSSLVHYPSRISMIGVKLCLCQSLVLCPSLIDLILSHLTGCMLFLLPLPVTLSQWNIVSVGDVFDGSSWFCDAAEKSFGLQAQVFLISLMDCH